MPAISHLHRARRVVANDLEAKPAEIYEVTFDDMGRLKSDFVAVRPDSLEFSVNGSVIWRIIGKFLVE